MIHLFARSVALAATLATPLPALALSCAPFGLSDAYLEAAASADVYVVVSGRLDFFSGDMPDTDGTTEPDPARFAGQVNGRLLSPDGFVTPFARQITVEVDCVLSWCGTLDAGQDYLMFLRKSGAGFVLSQAPCHPQAFSGSMREMEDIVLACHRGESCVATTY